MKRRTTHYGLVSLILSVGLGLPLLAAAQDTPQKPGPDDTATTKPADPAASQKAMEALRRINDELAREKAQREASQGEGAQASEGAAPATQPAGPDQERTDALRARAKASTQRGAQPVGPPVPVTQPGHVLPDNRFRAGPPPDFVGPVLPSTAVRPPMHPREDEFVGPPSSLANPDRPVVPGRPDATVRPEVPGKPGTIVKPGGVGKPEVVGKAEPGAKPEGPETRGAGKARQRRPRDTGEPSEWFDFDGAKWEDVIKHFVERIGKPLLGEPAIGGELTYKATRKFTKEEAIDELNLIMHEKGFRFVEEENHVYIVPLAEMPQRVPVKETYPTVKAFEAASPRDMDYVTVYYQVEDQPAQVYVDRFADALPDYTRLSALKESNQIKMVALAQDVRRFLALKDMVIIKPEDPRVMKAIEIKTNALEIDRLVRTFLNLPGGGGTATGAMGVGPRMGGMVRNPQTGAMMPAPAAPAGPASLETDVQMVADERTNTLIVKATADKMQIIEDLIATFDKDPGLGTFRTKVYDVKHADATEVATLINQILQQEQGRGTRTPAWQLQNTYGRMRMGGMGPGMGSPYGPGGPYGGAYGGPYGGQYQPSYASPYAGGAGVAPEDILTAGTFEQAKKTVRLVADTRSNSLIVYATDEGFKRVEEILTDIDQPRTDNYATFELVNAKVAEVAPLVNALAAGIRPGETGRAPTIVPDETHNVFRVIAERDQMERIEALIAELDVTPPEQVRHVLKLEHLRPSQVAQMVESLLAGAPTARSTPTTPRGPRFRPGMAPGAPGMPAAPVAPSATASQAPSYRIIALDEAQLLIVTCSDEDWAKVDETIRVWDKNATTNTPRLETFTIQKGNAAAVAEQLNSFYRSGYDSPAFGRTAVQISADGDKVLVFAIQPAIDEIGALIPTLDVPSGRDQLVILPLTSADATQVAQLLQANFGQKAPGRSGGPTIQAEPTTNSVIVIGADEATLARIKDFAQRMDETFIKQATEQRTYTMQYAQAQEVAQAVLTIWGGGVRRVMGGGQSGGQVKAMSVGAQVIVDAPKDRFATIEPFVKQMDAPLKLDIKQVKLAGADVSQVAQNLATTFVIGRPPRPDKLQARFIPDPSSEMVIISAPPDMMPEIDQFLAGAVEQWIGLALERQFYTVENADASYVADLVRLNLLPQVQQKLGPTITQKVIIGVDTRQSQVIVSAPKVVQPMAKELIAQLDQKIDEPPPTAIEIKYADPTQIAQVIQAQYAPGAGKQQSDVRVSVSGGALVVKAPKKKLAEIQAIVAELDQPPDVGNITVHTYDLKVMNALQVQMALQPFLTQLKGFTKPGKLAPAAFGEPTTNTLIVLGPPEVMPMIDELVTRIEGKTPPNAIAQTYTLTNVRAEQIEQMATNVDAMLKAKVAEREGARKAIVQTAVFADPGSNRLIVFAPKEYQDLAGGLIQMIDQEATSAEIVHIVTLEQSDAQQLAQSINQTLTGGPGGSGGRTGAGPGGGAVAGGGGGARARVIADVTSNSIILAGLPKDVADAEKLIHELDSKIAGVRVPEMRVFRPVNAMPSAIEKTLKGILPKAATPQDAVAVTADDNAGTVVITANRRSMVWVAAYYEQLDAPPPEAGAGGVRQTRIVDVLRGKASDIVWELRDVLRSEKEGGPSVEADWFDQYIKVKCRPAEFAEVEKWIREIEKRIKVDPKILTLRVKGNLPQILGWLKDQSGENIDIQQPTALPQQQSIIEEVSPEAEEPRTRRETPARGDNGRENAKPTGGVSLRPRPSAPARTQQWLDEVEADVTGATGRPVVYAADEEQPAGVRPEGRATPATSATPRAASPAAPAQVVPRTATPGSAESQPAKREPVKIVVQPDGTIVIKGEKSEVERLQKVIETMEEELTPGEVLRIFHMRRGDVSAAADVLNIMFNETRTLIQQMPQIPQQQQRGRGGQGNQGDDRGMLDQFRAMMGQQPQPQAGKQGAGGQRLRIATDPGHNYLIIKCNESDLPEIRRLLRELDIPPGEVQIRIFQLINLLADETAENLKDTLGITKAKQRRTGQAPAARPGAAGQQQQLIELLQQQLMTVPGVEGGAKVENVEIVPNATTNCLLVSAPPDVMALIERVISELEEQDSGTIVGIFYYQLQKAHVDDVVPLLQEIFQSVGGGGPMAAATGGSRMRAMTTGGSTGGGRSPAAIGPVTISADPRTDTVIYTAQKKDAPIVEAQIRKLDIDVGPLLDAEIYICRSNAESIAAVVEPLYVGRQPGVRPGPVGASTGDVRIVADAMTNTITVWASKQKRDEIFAKIESLDGLGQKEVGEIDVVNAPASQVANQVLQFLQQQPTVGRPGGQRQQTADGGQPQIVPNDAAKKIIVYGTRQQIEKVRELAAKFDDAKTIVASTKVVQLPLGLEAARLGPELARIINESEQGIADRMGVRPRRIVIGVDETTNSLILSGDPSTFGAADLVLAELQKPGNIPEPTTVIFDLVNLSATDAERLINDMQRRGGSSSARPTGLRGGGTGGGTSGFRPPSGGGVTTPPSTPRQPAGGGAGPGTRRGGAGGAGRGAGGGAAPSAPPPVAPPPAAPRSPGGAGGGGAAPPPPPPPSGGGAMRFDDTPLNDRTPTIEPCAWRQPLVATAMLTPTIAVLLAQNATAEDEAAVSQPAPPARVRRPTTQPRARDLRGIQQELQRDLEERVPPAARVEVPESPETAPATQASAGLGSVTGSLKGEVTAAAIDSRRLVIRGSKEDVAFIRQLLSVMDQTAGQAMIEVYPLQKGKAASLQSIINTAVQAWIQTRTQTPGPQDRFSVNAEARSNSLIVAASEPVMEVIRNLIDRLDVQPPEGVSTVRAVSLNNIRAAEAVAILQPLVDKLNKLRGEPADQQASIQANDRSNSVMILGSPPDIEEVQRLIEAVDVEISAEQKKKSFVRADAILITLQNAQAEDVAKVINDMIKAEQDAGVAAAGGGAAGAARPAGKPAVKTIKLHMPDGTELPELQLEYPIRIVPEKGTNSLIIFSTLENNEALKALVQVFDTLPLGPETDVKVFALLHAQAETVAKLLTDTFKDKSFLWPPGAGEVKGLQKGVLPPTSEGVAPRGLAFPLVVQFDARSNILLVIGRKDAVLLAAGLVKEIDRPTMDLALKPHVVKLERATAAALSDKLKKILDDRAKALGTDKNAARDSAVIYPDERSNHLIVLATEEVYEMVSGLIGQLDTAERYTVVDTRYRLLQYADARKLQGLLDDAFKNRQTAEKVINKDSNDVLTVLADPRSNALLLTGTRDYLAEAEKLIIEFDRQFDGSVVFKARKPQLNSAVNIAGLLKDMVDKALVQKDTKLTGTTVYVNADQVSDSLLLAASREDMAVLDRWVDILDRPSEVGRMTLIVPLHRGVAADVSKAVQDVFKPQSAGAGQTAGQIGITITADVATNSVVAFGPPGLLKDVEDFVRRLDDTEAPNRVVKMFKLLQADAQAAGDLLTTILQGGSGSVGGTGGARGGAGGAAAGRQDANKQVMLIVQQQRPDLSFEVLKALRSDVTVISDLRTNSLVVTAPPEAMPLMESLVAAVDVPPEAARIRVFPLRNSDAAQMVKMLQELFAQKAATPTAGAGAAAGQAGRTLAVGEGGLEGGQQQVSFTTDVRTNSVIAAGTPGYLDVVEKMVLALDCKEIADRKTIVYAPRNNTSDTVATSVKAWSDAEKARLQEIGTAVSTAMKQESEVVAISNKDANRVVLGFSPRHEDAVMSIVRSLDQPPPQVMIQVLILEVTVENSLDLGVEFAFQDLQFAKAGPTDTTTFDYVGGTDIGAAGSGLGGFSFTITGADFNFLFRTLQSESRLNVLSRPQIVAMDNQMASIDVSNDVPYVTGTAVTTGGVTSTSVARQKVGIKLEVTPQINPDGYVRMLINQEVDDLTGSTVQVGPGVTSPVFFTRTAKTTVTVKDNETVVLGGLITSRAQNTQTKVPLVGDLPGLGMLFRAQSDTTKRTELLLVLTPHVVRAEEDYRRLSAETRDQLTLIPDDVLHSPLLEGLRVLPEEPAGAEEENAAPAPTPGGTPAQRQPVPPAGDEYGPVRPVQRGEPAEPVDQDSYDVPLTCAPRLPA